MSEESKKEHARHIRRMFERVSDRYDRLNRLMTFGQNARWRKEVIHRSKLSPNTRLLDLGSGTGDLVFEALRQIPIPRPVACDFTRKMIDIGREHPLGDQVDWVIADALHLPFAANAFDRVVSGFLLRNVADSDQSLAEQYRILGAEGRIVCLETAPPRGPMRPLLRFYLNYFIPLLGLLFGGDRRAYRYLPGSTQEFLSPPVLAKQIRAIGFHHIGFTCRMLGVIAIHDGCKPTPSMPLQTK